MRSGTLSRTRIFRTDPPLDAAIAAAAEREETSASDWIRRTLQAVTRSSQMPPRPAATSGAAMTGG